MKKGSNILYKANVTNIITDNEKAVSLTFSGLIFLVLMVIRLLNQ